MIIYTYISRTIALLGLFFISIGTGGIKPCVFTFGGDQFQLPQQEKQLQHYTTNFMVAINLGALVSTFLTPELRNSVKCFGHDTCYPVAFGVPAALMLIAISNETIWKLSYTCPRHNVFIDPKRKQKFFRAEAIQKRHQSCTFNLSLK